MDILNYQELRAAARRRLPHGIFEYIDRGSEDEIALGHLRQGFDGITLAPRVLCGGAPRDQRINLFGKRYASPFIVAPTAFAGLVHYRGEIALAKAAAAEGIPFCAATEAITSVEDIAAESSEEIWFQLYLWERERLWRGLIARAWAHGVRVLVITVDTVAFAKREFNQRNGFGVPFTFSARNMLDIGRHPRWAFGVMARYLAKGGMPSFANYPIENRQNLMKSCAAAKIGHEQDLNWGHIQKLRDAWRGKLVVKGVLRPDDALRLASMGVDGIVVSNHGARNLDSAVAPIHALPAIANAVGNKMTVLADGGIRRGSDAFKLIAQGAHAVMIGRGMLYGTAIGGETGAAHVIRMLRDEFDTTMGLAGCKSLSDIGQDLIFKAESRFA